MTTGTFGAGNYVISGNLTLGGNATGNGKSGVTLKNLTGGSFCLTLNSTDTGVEVVSGAC